MSLSALPSPIAVADPSSIQLGDAYLDVRPASAAVDHGLSVLDAVVRELPFGVALFAQDGRCLLANTAATTLDVTARASGTAVWELAATLTPGDSHHVSEGVLPRPDGERVVETRVKTIQIGGSTYALTTAIDITDQRRIEQEFFSRAYLDELTGLPNRSLVQQSTEELIRANKPGETFALAFIDLDNFKHINDYYSHAVGDALLVKIAVRLSGDLRPGDVLARIGGDEFVLLASVVDRPTLEADIHRLVERLKQPFFIDGHEIFTSASIGVSLFPEHGRTYEMLRRNADSAMYRVKQGVKGGAVLFDETMMHAATARMALEQRLRLAIRDHRFCCAFQPKVDIRTYQVVGVEVLLRWRDDQGIIQAPGDFVSLAVELGLINEIAHLVLDETMRVLDEIDDAFGPNGTISLNIAAKQADDLAFMTSFVSALAATGCAERFMLELTEEAFFAKSRFQADVLPQLRAIGAGVSIDDFGVGYSSLAALAHITADELKIDRSFITDIHKRPRSQCVLKAIESLGRALGMSVLAEGVETAEELAYLQTETRIQHAQGYFFAKPALLEQVPRRMRHFLDSRANPIGREERGFRRTYARSGTGR